MKQVYDYIDAHFVETVEQLLRLVGQPSVSAQGTGVVETARLTAEMLESEGFGVRLLNPPAGPYPVVYAEQAGDSPTTLLFYNHYDVQPPEPLEQWTTPPFQPTVAGDLIRGRGVGDNKGNIVARLAAIRAFRAVRG